MPESLNSHLKTAVKGSVLILAATAASQLLWFLIKILIVRNTTKAEFGIYSLVLTVLGVLVAVVPLGIPGGLSRFVSVYLGEGKTEEADGVSRAGVQIMLAASLAAFVFLYFLAGPIARDVFYTPGLAGPLRMVSFLIPFTVYAGVVGGVLLGRGVIGQKLLNDILTPASYMLLILAVIFLHLRLEGILYAYTSSGILVSVLVAAYGFRKLGAAPFLPRGGLRHRELVKFSVPLMVSTIMGMILVWTDTLMIGRYLDPQAVGTYGVSVALAKLLLFPISALGFVFLPIAGEIYAKGQPEALNRAYQVLTKWLFAVTLPLFFVFFFFPEMSITTLFGARFLDAALPLRLLALGFMINAFLGTNGLLLMVMGLTGAIMNISIAAAVVNIALNYIFIKRMAMGIEGGALATMTSYILINVMYSVKLFRRSGVHPFRASYLKPAAGAAISGLVIYAVAKSLPLHFWMLPVYLIIFVAGYAAGLLLTKSMEAEDLFMMERVFKRLGVRPRRIMRVLARFTPGIEKPGVGM
ncbi:MAG: flippase [Nitrospiraceae bacterium]|nr:flippase [Nitrospiraceae bacterium]